MQQQQQRPQQQQQQHAPQPAFAKARDEDSIIRRLQHDFQRFSKAEWGGMDFGLAADDDYQALDSAARGRVSASIISFGSSNGWHVVPFRESVMLGTGLFVLKKSALDIEQYICAWRCSRRKPLL